MTSFVAWVGVDQRGPASVYLASDSRISWEPTRVWDHGTKLFACHTGPHLLGYIGDVIFPSLVLAQITSAIDLGIVFHSDDDPPQRFLRIESIVKSAFEGLPYPERRPFTIVYATRQLEQMNSTFHGFTLAWTPSAGWRRQEITTPSTSREMCILGSGGAAVSRWQERWDSSSQGGTSRAIFSAFCDAIHSGEDPLTGGAPQLVGLYRIGAGRPTGIVEDGRPFLFGIPLELDVAQGIQNLEWRNSVFERCSASGTRLEDTHQHHVPKGLGRSRRSPPRSSA